MITKITIDSITPARKKDGSLNKGTNKKGPYQLFLVKATPASGGESAPCKYWYNGEGEIDLTVGDTVEMKLESETNEYGTTTTISHPSQKDYHESEPVVQTQPVNGNKILVDEIDAIKKDLKETNERIDGIEEYLSKNLPKQ